MESHNHGPIDLDVEWRGAKPKMAPRHTDTKDSGKKFSRAPLQLPDEGAILDAYTS